MSVFVDTSALYAILDADDAGHRETAGAWVELVTQGADLVTANTILVETFALAQHRLGMEAVRTLQQDVTPMLRVVWVGEAEHSAGVTALLTASNRRLSLVDCISFEIMRRQGIRTALTLDRHFAQQGFAVLPGEAGA